jgi:hypothetical protein
MSTLDVSSLLAWMKDSKEIGTCPAYVNPSMEALVAAQEVLITDPDEGCGNPALIQAAADAARPHDPMFADWLEREALAWKGYLSGLGKAMANLFAPQVVDHVVGVHSKPVESTVTMLMIKTRSVA